MPEGQVTDALMRQTVDELRRAVDELRRTLGDYNVLVHRVGEIEKDLENLNTRRTTDRRMIIVAFVAPTALWLLQFFTSARGGISG